MLKRFAFTVDPVASVACSLSLVRAKRVTTLLVVAAGLVLARESAAQPILWEENGHYYEVVETLNLTWSEANSLAEAMTHEGLWGHLVTITSAREQGFLADTFQLNGNQRVYLGGFQDLDSPDYEEPDGAWSWVTGEEFSYENWNQSTDPATDEPNNRLDVPENFLSTFGPPGATASWTWNDLPDDASQYWGQLEWPTGYVVEYEPVPEPSTALLFAIAATLIVSTSRRKRF